MIRDLQPGARAIVPTLLATLRYLDDILFIFPLDIPGANALKQENGGPYPNSIGISSEKRGKRVSFLDVTLYWRRPRLDHKSNKREVVVLS